MENTIEKVDVVLVGGGIMSATLAVLLQQVRPDWTIVVFERLDQVALESSGAWNNAGTGHAALCELNYTPELPDGSIATAGAIRIAEQFQVSRQFWASLVKAGVLSTASEFIRPVPHLSYVRGEADTDFLRRRFEALAGHPLFFDLRLTEDQAAMDSWVPLMMQGRDGNGPMAMTRSDVGTDINFGVLARKLFDAFEGRGGSLRVGHEVRQLKRQGDGRWRVGAHQYSSRRGVVLSARFVFVGAGGMAAGLLQRAGIPEVRGYAGFPVGGQFLRCTNQALIERHDAKVYGKSTADAPPMAMPHLDTRFAGGKRGLMFGPYAGFNSRLLKQGSRTDLVRSVRTNNALTMLSVARDELPLTRFLMRQVRQTHRDRIETLREFIPTALPDDWELIHAGQRVQIMKRNQGRRGALVFGTEIVSSADGTMAGLLGASPGASVSPAIMLEVMERCFPGEYTAWRGRLRELVPSLGVELSLEPALNDELHAFTSGVLGLHPG